MSLLSSIASGEMARFQCRIVVIFMHLTLYFVLERSEQCACSHATLNYCIVA